MDWRVAVTGALVILAFTLVILAILSEFRGSRWRRFRIGFFIERDHRDDD